jgi:hypothetical protein
VKVSYDLDKVQTVYIGLDGQQRPVPVERIGQTEFYHYTKAIPTLNILTHGFLPSKGGRAERGVYVSGDTESGKDRGPYRIDVKLDPLRTRMVDITRGEGQTIWEAFCKEGGYTMFDAFAARYGYDLIQYSAQPPWYVLKNSSSLHTGGVRGGLGYYLRSLTRDPSRERTNALKDLRQTVEPIVRCSSDAAMDVNLVVSLSTYEHLLREVLRREASLMHQDLPHVDEFRDEATFFLEDFARLKGRVIQAGTAPPSWMATQWVHVPQRLALVEKFRAQVAHLPISWEGAPSVQTLASMLPYVDVLRATLSRLEPVGDDVVEFRREAERFLRDFDGFREQVQEKLAPVLHELPDKLIPGALPLFDEKALVEAGLNLPIANALWNSNMPSPSPPYLA